MGKYMRKARISGKVAILDVQCPSSLGVRTRAKTLALQRLQNSLASSEESLSYLQLRSRCLEKPFSVAKANNSSKSNLRATSPDFNPSPNLSTNNNVDESPVNSNSTPLVMRSCCSSKQKGLELSIVAAADDLEVLPENEAGIEVSLGENVLDYEIARKSRETTPCSFIRDPETIGTPGSTNRQTTSAVNARRMRPSETCVIPTAQEIDDFFARLEQAQQRKFAQKYNFDPAKEQPLPGRYEWKKSDA